MTNRGLKGFDNDSLAWLVWHFDQDPANEVQSEAEFPGFPARVRAEFALRQQRAEHKLLPRHLRR